MNAQSAAARSIVDAGRALPRSAHNFLSASQEAAPTAHSFSRQKVQDGQIRPNRRSHMKALFVSLTIAACVFSFALRAEAQAPAEHSMTGCLAKGDDAGTFKLTDLEKGPKEVVIAQTTANLTPHLGHKVEITGVAIPGKDKTHTMKVTAVKMISATCP
jgi:hypothetical protein